MEALLNFNCMHVRTYIMHLAIHCQFCYRNPNTKESLHTLATLSYSIAGSGREVGTVAGEDD